MCSVLAREVLMPSLRGTITISTQSSIPWAFTVSCCMCWAWEKSSFQMVSAVESEGKDHGKTMCTGSTVFPDGLAMSLLFQLRPDVDSSNSSPPYSGFTASQHAVSQPHCESLCGSCWTPRLPRGRKKNWEYLWRMWRRSWNTFWSSISAKRWLVLGRSEKSLWPYKPRVFHQLLLVGNGEQETFN